MAIKNVRFDDTTRFVGMLFSAKRNASFHMRTRQFIDGVDLVQFYYAF